MAAESEMSSSVQLEEETWEEQRQTRERVSNLMGKYLLKGYRMLSTTCSECENILLQTRDGSDYCVHCSEVAKAATTTTDRDGVSPSTVTGSQVPHLSTTPRSATSFTTATAKRPDSKTTSGGTGRTAHRVPTVCTGQTGDTTKLTTTPADHDTLKMCTDTKRTGMRTNPAITHSMGVPSTPPPDRVARITVEVPQSPAKSQQKALTVAQPQVVCAELGMQCQAELVSKLQWCTRELEKTESLEHSILICRLITAAGEALKTMQELSLSSPCTDHCNET